MAQCKQLVTFLHCCMCQLWRLFVFLANVLIHLVFILIEAAEQQVLKVNFLFAFYV